MEGFSDMVMKVFTLAIGNNGEIKLAGDMTLQEVQKVIEGILYQQAFEQGRQAQKQKIRKGYKERRNKG